MSEIEEPRARDKTNATSVAFVSPGSGETRSAERVSETEEPRAGCKQSISGGHDVCGRELFTKTRCWLHRANEGVPTRQPMPGLNEYGHRQR